MFAEAAGARDGGAEQLTLSRNAIAGADARRLCGLGEDVLMLEVEDGDEGAGGIQSHGSELGEGRQDGIGSKGGSGAVELRRQGLGRI